MRNALPVLCLLSLVAVPACGPREPLCSSAVDRTGRGVPLCDTISEAVVCDDPGVEARYERDFGGRLLLIDGTLAMCDLDNLPACADVTVIPRCIEQPPAP